MNAILDHQKRMFRLNSIATIAALFGPRAFRVYHHQAGWDGCDCQSRHDTADDAREECARLNAEEKEYGGTGEHFYTTNSDELEDARTLYIAGPDVIAAAKTTINELEAEDETAIDTLRTALVRGDVA